MMRAAFAAVLAGCAAGGAALGATGVGLAASGGTDAPSSSLPIVARPGPAVLERQQRAADLTGVPATPGLRRASLRRVGVLGTDDVLLVGRDLAGGRCIIAVSPAPGLFRAGCVPEAAFRGGGARVAWSEPPASRHRTAEWDADGTVRAGPSR